MTPIARPLGWDMGVLREFKVQPKFYLRTCCAISCCTALYRESTVLHSNNYSENNPPISHISSYTNGTLLVVPTATTWYESSKIFQSHGKHELCRNIGKRIISVAFIPYANSLHAIYKQNTTKITHRWTRLKTYRIRTCLPQLMADVTQRDQAKRTRFQPQIQPREGTRISSSSNWGPCH